MNHCCICRVFTHIFTKDFNFKGLTARRFCKSFGVIATIASTCGKRYSSRTLAAQMNVPQQQYLPKQRTEKKCINLSSSMYGVRGGVVGWGTTVQAGSSRVRISVGLFIFFVDLILPPALWGRLSLWHKWVPGISRGRKGGRCLVLITWPPSFPECLKILGISTSRPV
jgi:hypothetical protein